MSGERARPAPGSSRRGGCCVSPGRPRPPNPLAATALHRQVRLIVTSPPPSFVNIDYWQARGCHIGSLPGFSSGVLHERRPGEGVLRLPAAPLRAAQGPIVPSSSRPPRICAEVSSWRYNTIRPHEGLSWNRPHNVHVGLADPRYTQLSRTQNPANCLTRDSNTSARAELQQERLLSQGAIQAESGQVTIERVTM
jgi:hypothetical protein